MDSRTARREAERAARRQLAGDLVTIIGDLAIALTDIAAAPEHVATARAAAAELVEHARNRGRALIANAADKAAAADDHYATTYQAAIDAGWTTHKLADLGYPTPKRRRSKLTPASEEHTGTTDALVDSSAGSTSSSDLNVASDVSAPAPPPPH